MKKILLISTLLMSTLIAVCQDTEEEDDKRLNGVRFGYQLSNLTGGEGTYNDLSGFYAGIVRQKKLSPLFRIESGLEYMLAGAQVTDNSKLQLHYIVIPIQLHLKVGPFIGTAGLNADFKVHQNIEIAGLDVPITDENKAAFMDFAGNLGVGFKLWILTAEARYYYGFVDIKDGWHNNYFQLGLKLSF